MKPEIKKLWLEALRSGEYEQGTGRLHACGRYCCLGTLTDLYLNAVGEEWQNEGEYESLHIPGDINSTAYLPDVVLEWSGLEDRDPVIDDKGLSSWNDGGSSFTEIADLIEKHL